MDQYVLHGAALSADLPADLVSPANTKSRKRHLPGFGPLTPIETDWGPFPAQALRVNDRVRVRSGAFRPITFVDRVLLDEAFLDRNTDAQPILVQPGRLGYGMPKQAVLLAPGQELSVKSGQTGVHLTARDLLRAGIGLRNPERFLTYIVFGFDEPEDVCSAGLWLRVEPRLHLPDDAD